LSIGEPKGSTEQLKAWSDEITLNLSWLLQLSSALSFYFLLFLVYKFGHIKLGRPDEKPEFSLFTAAAMLLASATGPTLLIFGVAEPLYRARTNYYAQPDYHSQDEADMFVINMAVFRWGMMTWTHIALVAIAMSLASHRFGLPLSFRSCFYPVLGAYTWGWIGDTIDGIALVSTVVGGCITMGFTSWQIVSCMVYLEWIGNTPEEIGLMLVLTIMVATILSTASVISGLRGGVRFFSRVAFGLSALLLFIIGVMDETKFLLNLQVQEIGTSLQTSLFELNFWTDAFGQLRPGSGQALDIDKSNAAWFRLHAVLLYAA
jgi:choline/glycine/proline betaine transport protein